jgi:hypothetical protein
MLILQVVGDVVPVNPVLLQLLGVAAVLLSGLMVYKRSQHATKTFTVRFNLMVGLMFLVGFYVIGGYAVLDPLAKLFFEAVAK